VLKAASLPDATAEWMITELKAERERESGASTEVREKTEREIKHLDQQIDRLTAAYLEKGAFTPEEFRTRKNVILDAKQKLVETLKILDTEDVARFEPLIRFITRSKQVKYIAERRDPKELRIELAKTGSNLHLLNRELRVLTAERGNSLWKALLPNNTPRRLMTARCVLVKSHLLPIECPRWESNPHDR
jgi:hypothetical protein